MTGWNCSENMKQVGFKSEGGYEVKKHKSRNQYIVNGEVTILKTTKGIEFKIDTSLLNKCLRYTWCLSKTGYLVATVNYKVTKMHRYLLDVSDSNVVVDHINGDALDNRLANMRLCSNSENTKNTGMKATNTSGYVGIRTTKHGRYNVRIMINRKQIHVGNYCTFSDAIIARQKAEIKYYGEFSPHLCRTSTS